MNERHQIPTTRSQPRWSSISLRELDLNAKRMSGRPVKANIREFKTPQVRQSHIGGKV